jgi:sugar phosphate permease
MRLSALVSLRALILLVSSVKGSLLILPLDIVDILPLEVDGTDDGWTDLCSFVINASCKIYHMLMKAILQVFSWTFFSFAN